MRLEGKIAVITGGASGIGEAAVRIFVENGATVIIADVQNEAGEQLAASLAPSTAFVHCDVSKESDVSSAVDYAVEKYGRLDIMFSNAGVPGKLFPSPADITLEDLDRVLAVNVRGSYLCTKHAARVMIPNRRGCILYTSSLSSIVAMPNGPSYTASKHAIVGLMKSAAAALAPYGIRANCVSPTGLATPMVVDGLRGNIPGFDKKAAEDMYEVVFEFKGAKFEPEDVARPALFLCSEDARYISGHNLVIDGAFTASKGFSTANSMDFLPLKNFFENLAHRANGEEGSGAVQVDLKK
ncbi:hypothetical protein SUGI_0558040 [Cryptomeria japonica]|uniref:momilactone A synthase n=1 Tax=Cryptomeria japonica TaxID=3369 RepID=UPI002408BC94|nr:momilactone A synthase [Cryptomeria japonica]GLJ28361.1 hypothetical protein SUGI_0558040 [Cryptomeria japonica]